MNSNSKNNEGIKEWQDLVQLTQGRPFVVDRVRLQDNGVTIEGPFELPQLARLSADDQVFAVAFLRSHGSIKEMERIFGVSYPTIKARLTRLEQQLEFVETNPKPTKAEVLGRLKRGEISAEQAIQELEKAK